MKKIITFLILVLCVSSICMAVGKDSHVDENNPSDPDNPTNFTKKIVIQGGYDSVASISVDPIPIQSEGFRMGMPFPIDDPSAQFGNSDLGRQIAKWHVLANNVFVVDIEAEIMHGYEENNTSSNAYNKGLGYKLTFTYLLSYVDKGEKKIHSQDKSFSIDVPVSGTSKTHTFKNIDLLGTTIELYPDTLIGSAEGTVHFSFDQATSNRIQSDFNWFPDGNYNAVVKMVLKVKDK